MYQVDLDLIKSKRESKGYSLQKMADLMGLSSKVKYYRRENGEYNFKPEELPVLANVLGISLKKFLL